jgi:Uncharacterized protein conserved in bacteria
LISDNAIQCCLDAAYRYLTYRPRSEAEIKLWLHQRGFADEVMEKVITRLKEQNLIDDFAFAQFWKDNRLSFNPKSKRLIQRELKGKKVAREIIEQATKDIDDESNAYRIGCSRMHALAHLDYPDFHRRLSSYLGYRGFTYEIIKDIIARLWREQGQR